MKNISKKLLSLFCVGLLALPVLAACGEETPGPEDPSEKVDYVSQLKLDMTSNTKKQEVEVKVYIDGDTTHFTPTSNKDQFTDGIIKARYMAVNTPESTGAIEKWGKTASNFTHDKLATAENIIVESDDENWNLDNTSSKRLMLWVWYVPEGKEVQPSNYRNLNVELLQEGYGRSSKTAENRYGEIAFAALTQAQNLKLKLFGNEKDVNFYGGAAEPMSLKYLRFHLTDYIGRAVSVEGVVTAKFGNCAYIEDLDEDGVSYGMCVFYAYDAGELFTILSIGNRVNVVGKVDEHEWEYGTSYQLTDVKYNVARPNNPDNTTLISAGNEMPCTLISASDLMGNRRVTATFPIPGEETEENVDIPYGEAVLGTSVELKDLTVQRVSVTQTESSKGAMTITCQAKDGTTIKLRTEQLYKPDNSLYTPADLGGAANGSGAVISSVKGIVDKFSDEYQIAVYDWSCFTFPTAV